MGKFYSIILTAGMMCMSMAANAINITINIDNPEHVSIYTNYGSTMVEGIVAGDNQLTVEEYQQVQIKAKENAFITKVIKSMDGAEDSEQYVSNMTECGLYISSSDEGAKFTVTSVNADDARDGSCTVWVDDPSNVRVQRSGTYSDVVLAAGDNTVKYMTDKELPLLIGSVNYSSPLYQVKVNDEVVSPQGTMWCVTPANGDKIEIFANFPDIDVPVKFVYASDDAKGFVTGVTVNGETVDNYNDADFTVKAGSNVSISGNTGDYNLASFKINGISQSFYSPYSFTVTEETTIEIDAQKYGTVKAILDIDNPENVTVYRGYSYNNDIISGLNAGENEIELSETNAQLQIKAVSGSYITSVTAGEQTVSADYDNAYNVTVTEGMIIVVRSGAIERDSKAAVYIDSKEAAAQYFNFQRADRSSVDIATGYNVIDFYEGDNPFGLSWYGAEYANVYKNNEAVEPLYSGSTTYELNLANGDVVKIYLASDPQMLEAELKAEDGVDASKVAVTMDRVTDLADWAGKFDVLPGTEISIKPEADYNITVKTGDENVTANKDGVYVVTVEQPATITVSNDDVSGISEISTEKAATTVYNMQGIRMSGDIRQLPAGIYVINGKKVVKK